MTLGQRGDLQLTLQRKAQKAAQAKCKFAIDYYILHTYNNIDMSILVIALSKTTEVHSVREREEEMATAII